MKRKSKPPVTACYAPAVTNACPIVQTAPAVNTTEYAPVTFTPVAASFDDVMFRRLVHFRWHTGEYRAPDDCNGFMLGTTAILYPRQSNDPQAQQIQQLNYDNFISTLAEMIQEYAPQIQKLRERQ